MPYFPKPEKKGMILLSPVRFVGNFELELLSYRRELVVALWVRTSYGPGHRGSWTTILDGSMDHLYGPITWTTNMDLIRSR